MGSSAFNLLLLTRGFFSFIISAINSRFTGRSVETSFSRFADYESSQNLASVEDDLIADINGQLTQDIFNRAVSNW